MRNTLIVGLILNLVAVLPAAGFAQNAPVAPPAALNGLARRLAEEVRRLGVSIAADLGKTDVGRSLSQDTEELARAVDEFLEALGQSPDPFARRRAYAGIDASLHHLQGRLAQPGNSTPAIERETQRLGRIDSELHNALGLNAYPVGFSGNGRAPTGMPEIQRLARALGDRAEALAAVVRAALQGPGSARALQDAANLALAADNFHDGLDLGADIPLARNGFPGVDTTSNEFKRDLAATTATPRVADAWRSFKATEVLLRQALGLPNVPDDLLDTAIPANGPSPVVGLADQLVSQVTEFLQVFAPRARIVPEGGLFLGDALQLQAAATRFRNDTARGLNPGQLAFEFRNVDALWQRMARRSNRISRGRTGPTIQQIGLMGQTLAKLHQVLGLPGYPPVVGPFSP